MNLIIEQIMMAQPMYYKGTGSAEFVKCALHETAMKKYKNKTWRVSKNYYGVFELPYGNFKLSEVLWHLEGKRKIREDVSVKH